MNCEKFARAVVALMIDKNGRFDFTYPSSDKFREVRNLALTTLIDPVDQGPRDLEEWIKTDPVEDMKICWWSAEDIRDMAKEAGLDREISPGELFDFLDVAQDNVDLSDSYRQLKEMVEEFFKEELKGE